MLLAKLTQPVEKIYQGEGLQTITVSAEYLAAQVDNYTMGQLKTQFYYKIGKVEFDGQDNPITFDPVIRGYVVVDAADLENWGTDDFVALQAVASALNLEVEDEQFVLEGGLFKS
jgi:hypothetical protein